MKQIILYPLTILLLAIGFSACDQYGNLQMPFEGINIIQNRIRFDSLEVGQTNKYVRLTGENYYDSSVTNFTYHTDTLVLEIIANTQDGFLVEEYLTEGSIALSEDSLAGASGIYSPQNVYQYLMQVTNDSLYLAPYSETYVASHFWGYQIPYNGISLAPITETEVDIEGWKTSFDYCECYNEGYTQDWNLFGVLYGYLNVIVDDIPMQLDGEGETIVYGKEVGVVRITSAGWWTQSGSGWDLLL